MLCDEAWDSEGVFVANGAFPSLPISIPIKNTRFHVASPSLFFLFLRPPLYSLPNHTSLSASLRACLPVLLSFSCFTKLPRSLTSLCLYLLHSVPVHYFSFFSCSFFHHTTTPPSLPILYLPSKSSIVLLIPLVFQLTFLFLHFIHFIQFFFLPSLPVFFSSILPLSLLLPPDFFLLFHSAFFPIFTGASR